MSSEWSSLFEPAGSGTGVVNQRGSRWAARLLQGVRDEGAYLVPLRLFIGLGWLRAGAEKVSDPGWRDGSSLAAFLGGHLAAGEVAFPWYETLIGYVFLPHAAVLALLIVVGQFLAGGAIAAGILTNAALLGGLFMNLNFLLAGAPNPSAFYIVIQVALLLTNAGAVLGLDAALARSIRSPLLVAQPSNERHRRRERIPALPVGMISLIGAVYALAHVTDWSPAGSVADPAMIVAITALLGLLWATIAWLRQDASARTIQYRRDSPSRSRRERLQHAADALRLPRLAALTNGRSSDGRNARRRSPRQQRRLALTVTLTWLDDPSDGDDQPADTTPRTAPRTHSRPVPASS